MCRPEWHARAACRGTGTDAFFPRRGTLYDGTRQLCAECPVREECLETALADSKLVGLWGGTTPAQRREMRRERAVA